MTAFQRQVWFNKEILDIFNDTSGFQDVAMVGAGRAVATLTTKDGSSGCALLQQDSHAVCTEGVSFGCDVSANAMWTDHGCRGVFQCGSHHVSCNQDGIDDNHTCPCTGSSGGLAQVWVRPTADGGAAVALHNEDDTLTQTITIDFSLVTKRQWGATTKLQVRDLWTHADVGAFVGSYNHTVEPHGTAMLKLMPTS